MCIRDRDISAEMKRTGLPLRALIVELTESDLLEQNINEKHFLSELRRMGISLAPVSYTHLDVYKRQLQSMYQVPGQHPQVPDHFPPKLQDKR